VFFGGLLALGWAVVPDYGSFGDEESCRESGQYSLQYVAELLPPSWLPARAVARLREHPPGTSRLANYADRDYGVAFELPLTVIEQLTVPSTDLGAVLRLRHRAVFLVCFGGLLAFYWLARARFGSWRLALLAALLLVLSPRQLADAFYNCKDGVFMAAQLVATATMVAFVRRPTPARAAWCALAGALAINVRIMAVLGPVLTLSLVGLRWWADAYAGQRPGRALATYAALLPVLTVAFWPYLWAAPLTRFTQTFASMAHFRWHGLVLFDGRLVDSYQLPWQYAPTWMLLTTPLLYVAGLGLAAAAAGWRMVRDWRDWRGGSGWPVWRGWRTALAAPINPAWQDLLLWGLGLGPLLAVVGLRSVLYDGWRQLYFVYPPLLLLALGGLRAAWQAAGRWQLLASRAKWVVKAGRGALLLIVLLGLAEPARQLVRLHPFQHLYFNALAGAHPEQRYEYDYWALSLRPALAWIAAHDARADIRVRPDNPFTRAAILDQALLPAAARARLFIERDSARANYFVTTYRFHPQPYPGFGPPVYTLRVEGRRVLDIFQLK